jgi:hypothetical protein
MKDTYGTPGLPAGFVELPARIYDADPMWIPEDPAEIHRQFSPSNPWFSQGHAQTWCFPGKARVAAFFDPANRIEGRHAAFFGYWETINDLQANVELFRNVEHWATQEGAEVLYGPVNFTTYGTCRLRVAVESGGVTFPGEPYNPPYYPPLLAALGFVPCQHYSTGVLSRDQLTIICRHLEQRHKNLVSLGYRFVPLGAPVWIENLPALNHLVDSIFRENLAYTLLNFESFSRIAGASLIRKACPFTSVMAYGPQGDTAGFILVIPHYGPLVVARADRERVGIGNLNYQDHLPLLSQARQPDVLLKTVGVSPSCRNIGLMSALIVEAFSRGMNRWNQWFTALIRSGNWSAKVANRYVKIVRRYVLYRKEIR